MSWTTIKEGIRGAIALCLDLEDYTSGGRTVYKVEWEDRRTANRWDVDGVQADLRLISSTEQGPTETRSTYDAGEDAVNTAYGAQLTLAVSCTIYSDNGEPGYSAHDLASAIRLKLRSPGPKALLAAGDVAVQRIGSIVDASYVDADSRLMSAAVVDLLFNAIDTYEPATASEDYVGTASGTGTLTNVDGTETEVTFDTA